MSFLRRVLTLGFLPTLCVSACSITPALEQGSATSSVSQAIVKTDTRKIYVHMMPWFELNGYHWDKVGRKYNPQIGPYHSGDYNVIEYQMLLMKYSGIDGVIIDWPGRSTAEADLPTNAENTDQIIDQTAKFGMEFAVCFEDQYATSANDAINSMHWVRDHYFNRPNAIKINGAPALFVFGPQKLGAGDWPGVLAATGTDPAFFTLWYNTSAGNTPDGTYAWIYSDALTGVGNYYKRTDQGLEVPVLYPGFNTGYADGSPGWSVGYDLGGDTFTSLWNLAKNAGKVLQIATWNDYSEGTMIEPSNEFGYRFLTTLQKLVGTPYNEDDLKIVRQLYDARKAGNAMADAASQALLNLDVAGACKVLGCTAPVHPGVGPTGTGGATGMGGATNNAAGAPSAGGTNSAGSSSTGGSSNRGGATASSGSTSTSAGAAATGAGAGADASASDGGQSGGCSVSAVGTSRSLARFSLALGALLVALRRRRSAH